MYNLHLATTHSSLIAPLAEWKHRSIGSICISNKKLYTFLFFLKSAAMTPIDVIKLIFNLLPSTYSRHRSDAPYWCEEVSLRVCGGGAGWLRANLVNNFGLGLALATLDNCLRKQP